MKRVGRNRLANPFAVAVLVLAGQACDEPGPLSPASAPSFSRLNATILDQPAVRLTWDTDRDDLADRYEIERAVTDSAEPGFMVHGQTSETIWFDHAVTWTTTYIYRVLAIGPGGQRLFYSDRATAAIGVNRGPTTGGTAPVNLESGTRTWIDPNGDLGSVQMDPGQSFVAGVSSEDNRLVVLDAATGNRQAEIPFSLSTWFLGWSSDGRLAISNVGTIDVYDAASGTTTTALTGVPSETRTGAWLRSDTHLAAGYESGKVRIWNVGAGTVSATIDDAGSAVRSLAYSDNQQLLAAGLANGDLVIYDTVNWTKVTTIPTLDDELELVRWLTGTTQLATRSDDGIVRVWDSQSWQAVRTINQGKLSPYGTLLATRADSFTLEFWHAGTGIMSGRLEPDIGAIRSYAWGVTEQNLVVSGVDGTSLWELTFNYNP